MEELTTLYIHKTKISSKQSFETNDDTDDETQKKVNDAFKIPELILFWGWGKDGVNTHTDLSL